MLRRSRHSHCHPTASLCVCRSARTASFDLGSVGAVPHPDLVAVADERHARLCQRERHGPFRCCLYALCWSRGNRVASSHPRRVLNSVFRRKSRLMSAEIDSFGVNHSAIRTALGYARSNLALSSTQSAIVARRKGLRRFHAFASWRLAVTRPCMQDGAAHRRSVGSPCATSLASTRRGSEGTRTPRARQMRRAARTVVRRTIPEDQA